MNDDAIDVYLTHKDRIDAILRRLQAASDDHFGNSPEDIDWGDVGRLADVAAQLKGVCDMVFQENGYSDEC